VAHYKGRIVEILLEGYQNAAAILACSKQAVPKAGEYLQAYSPTDPLEVVATSLFSSGDVEVQSNSDEFVSLPITGSLPESWLPGTQVLLRGPFGNGFNPPKRACRIALVALETNPGRLIPLISAATGQGAEVALFSESDQVSLPLTVELQKLRDLSKGLRWADYLAADVNLKNIQLMETLPRIPTSLISEILISAPMPCGGMAKCGICSLHTRKGSKLACEDGPVFNLREIVPA
jgi:NAD(P)H-flavin reductase